MRALLLCLTLALAACATPETPSAETETAAAANHLSGTTWVRAGIAGHPPTIDFNDAGASGFAGCNRWFGQVEQVGERLVFSSVGVTRMACPEPQMTVESDFLAVLERTRFGHYDEDALVLLDEAQTQIARFERPR